MDNKNMTIEKRDKYTMTIEVDQNMASLHKRNNPRVNGVDENKRRIEGEKSVDLWEKGELFPIDSTKHSHSEFKNVTRLVNFLCSGKKGLLGYCENIKGNCRDLQKKFNNLLSTIFYLEEINKKLVESDNQIQNMVLV
jgi:hypothetical protein